MVRWVRFVPLFAMLTAPGCTSQEALSPSSREAAKRSPGPSNLTVDPFDGLELPTSEAASEVDETLLAVWITPKAMVLGSRQLGVVRGGELVSPDETLAALDRALKRGAKRSAFALGADGRIPYRSMRKVLTVGRRAGLAAVELRVGERGRLRGLRVCLRDVSDGQSCWGWGGRSGRGVDAGEPARDGDVVNANDGGALAGEGDIGGSGYVLSSSEPLGLQLSVEPDNLSIALGDRTLRTLPFPAEGQEESLERLGDTLRSLRLSNSWDRTVKLRIGEDLSWNTAVMVLTTLAAGSFDQVQMP